MRFYGIDFRDALWGAEWRTPQRQHGWIGVRRLRSLIDGLGAGSALARAMDPPAVQFREATAEFSALIVEQLDAFRNDFIQANSKEGWRRPEQFHIRRPWEPDEKTELSTGADLFVFIKRLGAGG